MTTQLQSKMIQAIARSVYNAVDGGEPESAADAVTWAEMVIETAQDRGVFTSLMNAGLVWHNGESVGLTESGFAAYQQLK